MKGTKRIAIAITAIFLLALPTISFGDLKAGEKVVLDDFRSAIPTDKFKSVEDLHATWEAVQAGKSEALIVDIRTEAEFNAGHIIGSSNIDSGHAYGLPKKVKDANKEIWVFCRTKHRASYFVGELYKFGYSNVYLVEGGIKAWAEKGYTLGNKYLGEITVAKYHKTLKEDFFYRENN
ncbi:MAG: rhodanese-like domain-containing protein [Thermodesulfobacteriota bacterium]